MADGEFAELRPDRTNEKKDDELKWPSSKVRLWTSSNECCNIAKSGEKRCRFQQDHHLRVAHSGNVVEEGSQVVKVGRSFLVDA